MKLRICSAVFFFLAAVTAFAQTPELKFIADTLVVQADGTYDADPDLATLTFQIFAQDKDLKRAYDTATRSINTSSPSRSRMDWRKTTSAAGC